MNRNGQASEGIHDTEVSIITAGRFLVSFPYAPIGQAALRAPSLLDNNCVMAESWCGFMQLLCVAQAIVAASMFRITGAYKA